MLKSQVEGRFWSNGDGILGLEVYVGLGRVEDGGSNAVNNTSPDRPASCA